jgi:hypothetical protein
MASLRLPSPLDVVRVLRQCVTLVAVRTFAFLPILFVAGFLAACSGNNSKTGTVTVSIAPLTVDGHTITRVLIPPTFATTP